MCRHLTGLWAFKSRLKHTQLNSCEKEELLYFLYLIQIFNEILFTKVVKQCAPALLTQDGMYVRVANVVADHNIEGICK